MNRYIALPGTDACGNSFWQAYDKLWQITIGRCYYDRQECADWVEWMNAAHSPAPEKLAAGAFQ